MRVSKQGVQVTVPGSNGPRGTEIIQKPSVASFPAVADPEGSRRKIVSLPPLYPSSMSFKCTTHLGVAWRRGSAATERHVMVVVPDLLPY
jgi:hypothetical protein